MKKSTVIVAPGFEEAETLTIADILRRAHIDCRLVGLDDVVAGAHGIQVRCDQLLSDEVCDFDMIILPGGYGGVDAMLASDKLIEVLKQMADQGKYIGAMCAAPVVLEKANLLSGKNFTAYKGYDQKIAQGHFCYEKTVVDGHLITSRGPATAYAFAYKLVELLGKDAIAVKNRMVYFNAFQVPSNE